MKIMSGRTHPQGCAAILLMLSFSANASSLFDSNDVLELSLTGPIEALISEMEDETEKPFVLRTGGDEQLIGVRARGKSRKVVCKFPPLRLEFGDENSRETLFAGQRKLKLVTHCNDRGQSTNNLLEEYAAYRIFNRISEIGYKVRLVRITYTDSDQEADRPAIERYGFLIESADELAGRIGGEPIKKKAVSLRSLDLEQAAKVFIFQYLIANTDWSLVSANDDNSCCHNGDLFQVESKLFFVPYDFDRAGIVNARYAKPDPGLRISRVTKRLYRGYCIDSEPLAAALRDIKSLQDEITDEIRQIPGFDQKASDKTIEFLDGFFNQAEKDSKLLQSFERRCL